MTQKKITEMNIGDKFAVEYGCEDNWTTAIILDIRPTETDYIKEVDYTIPQHDNGYVRTDRMINVDLF